MRTRTLTYQLKLLKVDEEGKPLANVGLTVRTADGGYVQADGSVSETPHEYKTDEQGMVVLPRVDEGTYVISQTFTPEGYDAPASDVTIELAATKDNDEGVLSAISVSAKGGNGMAEPNKDTGVVADGEDGVCAIDPDTGAVTVRMTTKKHNEMPDTGGIPKSLLPIVVGGAMVAIGALTLVVLRNDSNDDEEA